MLKTLKLPTAEEFEVSLDEAPKWAASVGYEESDVDDIIKSARRNKKYENCYRYNCFMEECGKC